MNLESGVGSDYETEGVLSEASSNEDLLIKQLELKTSKSVSSLENSDSWSQDASNAWVPLQLCYGIPLFDGDLNEEITRKVEIFFLLTIYFSQFFLKYTLN